MAKRRKPRKCRICKKSPVWRGGDVKDPGPFCKKCYHKKIWVNRPGARDEGLTADDLIDFLIEGLPAPPPPGEPYPDDDDWTWICRTYRGD